jgi:hypothetical protein
MTLPPGAPPPRPQPSWESAPLSPGLPPGHDPFEGSGPGGWTEAPVGGLPLPPLEDPSAGNLGQRALSTMRELLLRPGAFFERAGNSEEIGWPLLFGALMSTVSRALQVGSSRLFGSSFDAMFARVITLISTSAGSPLPAGTFPASSPSSDMLSPLATILLMPVFYAVSLFVGAGVIHVGLLLAGGAKRSFLVTVRVVAYASVAQLAGFVPVVGPIVVGVYSTVLEVLGLSRAHRTDMGRALIAVLLPGMCACACAGAAIATMGALLLKLVMSIAAPP